jgi:acyl transferase domain-containing protein/acyl carrier protein/ubiquinone/menaquinone biosynthesis C-methylase UbiE
MNNKNIAIIGIACRFPGAKNYHEFWNNLKKGINSIREIPPERWDLDEYYSPIIDEPNKSISKWCGLLDNIDQFDNRFFSISPREAKQMDPQQRLLLEETWHCIEDSGISVKTLQQKKTSVYVGVMASDYHQESMAPGIVTDSYAALGNYDCILANRISYTFGFQGASQSIDAACAASMVALHNAKASLLSGESDYAIAAGVSLNFHPWKYISFSKSRMLSPDGQCKTFDKDANGYVPGEGVGVLLLQPLEDAIRARNHIYGIIKGSAVNHGGQTLSITAPRVEAQRDVILAAYKDAQMTPESVTYVEAHGTGTSLGDPIEVEALTRAFRQYTNEHQFCQIGSVKTNIGHLEAAAGIAGVIKVLLMMRHQQIPPTLNIKTLNPVIHFENSPFVVATQLQDWHSRTTDLPLRAGISSFGFGGVNSHALIESFSHQANSSEKKSKNLNVWTRRLNFLFSKNHSTPSKNHFFILSAKSTNALQNLIDAWKLFVSSQEFADYQLADICVTLTTGRSHFRYRYGVYVSNKEALKTLLNQQKLPDVTESNHHPWCLRIGDFSWDSFADLNPLLEQPPLFKKHLNAVEQCLSALDIPKKIKRGFKKRKSWSSAKKPLYSFIATYAYLKTLMDLGFAPRLITGEQSGLWASLTLSGITTLEDTLLVLSQQKNLAEIELARPQIPFYDSVNHQTLLPYQFDESYLHELIDDLNIATADVHHFVERARLLKDSQFTFKSFLEEWGIILRQHAEKELDSMLENDALFSDDDQYRKQKILLLIIIKSSLRQLDQKWDLTRPKRINEQKFQELLDLIVDGVMPKEVVIELFLGQKLNDWDTIAAFLTKRQDHLNQNKPYEFLKKHQQKSRAITDDVKKWFEKAIAIHKTEFSFPNVNELTFGQLTEKALPDNIKQVTIRNPNKNQNFQDAILQLWLHGVDINWDILYHNHFDKVSLPTYGFERASFWLTEKHKEQQNMAAEFEDEDYKKPSSSHNIVKDYYNAHINDVFEPHQYEQEIFLTFAPLPEIIPGFSGIHQTLLIDAPNKNQAHYQLTLQLQKELRAVLFRQVDFSACQTVLDIGCGVGSDLITLAEQHHHLQLHGYSISDQQIHRATRRAREKGLQQRLTFFHRDSAKDEFPGEYDLAFGFEVVHHIKDKLRLFSNIGRHLKTNGFVVMADFISNVSFTIEHEETSSYFITAAEWLELFSQNHLKIIDCIDVSHEIANFLHDSDFESRKIENTIRDQNVRSAIQSYHQLGKLLRKGLASYVLMTVQKQPESITTEEINAVNKARIHDLIPYSTAVQTLKQNSATSVESQKIFYYQPVWENAPPLVETNKLTPLNGTVLLFDTKTSRQTALQQRVAGDVILVEPSTAYQAVGTHHYYINPNQRSDYHQLLADLKQRNQLPTHIVHLWSQLSFHTEVTALKTLLERGIYSVFYLTQALLEEPLIDAVQWLYIYTEPRDEPQPQSAALSGFIKTIALEHSKFIYKTIALPNLDQIIDIVLTEFQTSDAIEIRYSEHQRWRKRIQESNFCEKQPNKPLITENGVYLITGGAGGLGLIFADYLAKQANVKLVLTGRTATLDTEQIAQIDAIKALGSEVLYLPADVSKRDDVQTLIAKTKARFHQINGIIHTAGVIKDARLVNKTTDEMTVVFAPKVFGTVYLDDATQTEPLDFFVLFSSIVAVIGNIGQCDYAYANSFLDNFALWREQRRSSQQRFGQTLAINWPLWQSGGMRVDEQQQKWFADTIGMYPLSTNAGLKAFSQGLASEQLQFMLIQGDRQKMNERLRLVEQPITVPTKAVNSSPTLQLEDIQHQLQQDLVQIAASILNVNGNEIGLDEQLSQYGFESISLIEFANRINAQYQSKITPAIFFEHPSLRSLSDFLSKTYQSSLFEYYQQSLKPVAMPVTITAEKDSQPSEPLTTLSLEEIQAQLKQDLVKIAASILNTSADQIGLDDKLSEYGFESISLIEFANRLNAEYQLKVTPAIFFEHASLSALSDFLCQTYQQPVFDFYQQTEQPNFKNKPVIQNISRATEITVEKNHQPSSISSPPETVKTVVVAKEKSPIAIIGMSGVMPQSKDLNHFWQHLAAGDHLITQVPLERWDWQAYHNNHPALDTHKNKTKWGGFMPEVDKFDSLFFGMSPREAELTDPQQRLFLETVWKTLEDAGYNASDLRGSQNGLFVGVAFVDFQDILTKEQIIETVDAHFATGIHHSMVANRVSYLLDWHGPSEGIDTACSSSLVAIHRAVEAIRHGYCEMAIAGGVNVMLNPSTSLSLSKAGMLSDDGRCKTFDKQANGYVRGEGVGAILLKSLEQAEADGDHIYAVIKGSAENHGGYATFLTAPNPNAQAELLVTAYQNANIDPTTVSYIETHGTGTSLGDPVEINGLKNAFAQLYQKHGQSIPKQPHCGLGSVKTNIGHLEAASGMAGIFKILLAMKHQTLPGLLHFSELNPYIDLQDSPFYLVTDKREWTPLTEQLTGQSIPRRAGVSSFGFGGTNAHIVLEEYQNRLERPATLAADTTQLIVMSAKNNERLQAYAKALIDFLATVSTDQKQRPITITDKTGLRQQIQQQLLNIVGDILNVSTQELHLDDTFSEYGFDAVNLSELAYRLNNQYQLSITSAFFSEQVSIGTVAQYVYEHSQRPAVAENTLSFKQAHRLLANIAYTLQVGRESMEERLALLVSSLDQLRDKLSQYLEGKTETETEHFYQGRVKTKQSGGQSDLLIDGPEGQEYVLSLIKNNKLTKLAQLWVAGVDIDWHLLYADQKRQRISLPTYPFARERHWLSTTLDSKPKSVSQMAQKLHPLLGSNTSTLAEQQFTTQLTGDEFYLSDHVVGGYKTLPGVAYLEMAYLAGEIAGQQPVQKLSNIVWTQPITVSDSSQSVHISLYPDNSLPSRVDFEVTTIDENQQKRRHAEGKITYQNQTSTDLLETFNLQAIQARCSEIKTGVDCYQLFQTTGLNYGRQFQTIQTLYRNDHEALSHLQLSTSLTESFNQFVLHPSLMDGALQTVIGLLANELTAGTPYLPFALEEIERFLPLTNVCYAYARWSEQSLTTNAAALNKLTIFILNETGQVLIRLKNLSVRPLKPQVTDIPATTMYYHSVWKPSAVNEPTDRHAAIGTVLLFDTDNSRYAFFKQQLQQPIILVKPGDQYQVLEPQIYAINPNQPDDYRQLLTALRHQMPTQIIHLWSQATFVNEPASLKEQLQKSLYSCFHLSQALLEQQLDRTIQFLYLYLESFEAQQPHYAAISGLAKTVLLENPLLSFKTVALPSLDNLFETVLTELKTSDSEVRYQNGQRWLKHWQAFDASSAIKTGGLLKQNGVYLITGGAGGLGFIFAEYLAKQFKAKLVLTGRSELISEQTDKIQSLNRFGAEVIYQKADISKRDDVISLIALTKFRFNQINGIIHSAGVIQDAFVLKKTPKEIAAVLAPKVDGTIYLDEVTQHESLDFLVLFSSIAAVTGNIGQCDYAYANSFMDHFALWREKLRQQQKRVGKTLSINWSLWQNGGMQIDEQTKTRFKQTMGLMSLSTESGLLAFETGLDFNHSQMLVVEGFPTQINRLLNTSVPLPSEPKKPEPVTTVNDSKLTSLQQLTQQYLTTLLSKEVKLAATVIRAEEPLEKYGLDSMMVMNLTRRLEQDFGELSKTLLFEYQTLDELVEYFIQHHRQQLIEQLGLNQPLQTKTTVKISDSTESAIPRFVRPSMTSAQPTPYHTEDNEDIAIIGISGRYPQAYDLADFWDNLTTGKDCITEIPADRWDYQQYYHPDKQAGKIYNKWGGFIDDVDKFDSLFFNISPREAELMDPQERLFLETVWQTLEDAGYPKSRLWQQSVGVFVGVMYSEYQLFGAEQALKGHLIAPSSSYASIANRVSYYFNWTGPSIALDTMCSSSLTAIHLACQSLKRGETKVAIAGGVNVSIHPQKYLLLSQGQFASSDGRCRSFGEGGDGYVPGEGVGAVLLKPLSQAQADHDQIYAVIKGSFINHGGKTNGYTVPNPNAQADLIATTLNKAAINPRTISYVEAHGTGTSLGDPIEITGLNKAYQTQDKQYCPIGSVKSNIGHLESAAGIAGLTKVLLQLKHKQLVPSLHGEPLNPNINFKESPFYVQQTVTDWDAPVISEGNTEKTYPRRAAVSSFGAGGANGHIIVEEFPENPTRIRSNVPVLIILSAKNKDRLQAYSKRFIKFLDKNPNVSLLDLAYTLQVGREALEERLVIKVVDREELIERLKQYLVEDSEIPSLYTGNIKSESTKTSLFIDGEAGEAFINVVLKNQELDRIAQLWISGIEIDWELLYQDSKPQRISLPTYPFVRERYWIPMTEFSEANWAQISRLHPLVEQNTSSLNNGQMFTTRLTGHEFFLTDHRVGGKKAFPGVAYIEMARAAGTIAGGGQLNRLTHIVWQKLLEIDNNPRDIDIRLIADKQTIGFEVSHTDQKNPQKTVYSHGKLEFVQSLPMISDNVLDIEAIQHRCNKNDRTARMLSAF